jgi:RNA polymerase sigma-70 factor (ECF subfamily)
MTNHVLGQVPQLFEADATGESSAADTGFERFYTSAFPRVYSFIRSQVGSPQTAQDVVSRIFLKAFRHHSKAPQGSAAMVWLFRIAHTVLIDYWRVEGRRESSSVPIEDLAEFPGSAADPEAAYVKKERNILILTVLSQLDKDDRTILGLKFTAQQTNREIAAILELSEGAVSMRLLRALRRLRERLSERGIES